MLLIDGFEWVILCASFFLTVVLSNILSVSYCETYQWFTDVYVTSGVLEKGGVNLFSSHTIAKKIIIIKERKKKIKEKKE